jgi:hypothetical protein
MLLILNNNLCSPFVLCQVSFTSTSKPLPSPYNQSVTSPLSYPTKHRCSASNRIPPVCSSLFSLCRVPLATLFPIRSCLVCTFPLFLLCSPCIFFGTKQSIIRSPAPVPHRYAHLFSCNLLPKINLSSYGTNPTDPRLAVVLSHCWPIGSAMGLSTVTFVGSTSGPYWRLYHGNSS